MSTQSRPLPIDAHPADHPGYLSMLILSGLAILLQAVLCIPWAIMTVLGFHALDED